MSRNCGIRSWSLTRGRPMGCSGADAGPTGAAGAGRACARAKGGLGKAAPTGADALAWARAGRNPARIEPEASAAKAMTRNAELFIAEPESSQLVARPASSLVAESLLLVASAKVQRAVGGRGETSVAFEYLVEAREIAKADILGHLGDGKVTGSQKYLGSLKAYLQEVIAEGNAQHLPESMREAVLAHPNPAR